MKKFLKENKWTLIRILISVLLIVVAFIVEKPVKILSIILFILAYGAVAYSIIFGAFKDLVKKKMVAEKMLMTIASIGAMIIGEYF